MQKGQPATTAVSPEPDRDGLDHPLEQLGIRWSAPVRLEAAVPVTDAQRSAGCYASTTSRLTSPAGVRSSASGPQPDDLQAGKAVSGDRLRLDIGRSGNAMVPVQEPSLDGSVDGAVSGFNCLGKRGVKYLVHTLAGKRPTRVVDEKNEG